MLCSHRKACCLKSITLHVRILSSLVTGLPDTPGPEEELQKQIQVTDYEARGLAPKEQTPLGCHLPSNIRPRTRLQKRESRGLAGQLTCDIDHEVDSLTVYSPSSSTSIEAGVSRRGAFYLQVLPN